MAMPGISTALSGLYASQKAIDTTGNNIANANTPGYTRQRVDTVPVGNNASGFWSNPTIDTGRGVSIEDIKRVRDEFLEKQTVTETSKQGTANRVATTFDSIEQAFGEPGDNGIQTPMAEFLNSFDDVIDESTAGQPAALGQTVALNFQRVATALGTIDSNSRATLGTNVDKINSIAKDIASLNKSIQTLSNTSGNVNNLLDQRDQLVRDLSSLANVTATTTDAGAMTVTINGATLVSGKDAHALQIDDSTTPVVIRWDDGDGNMATGNLASVDGGDVGGLLQTINTIVPSYRSKLDTAAVSLMTAVNAQHRAGYDANGNAGADFFTGTSAATMNVNTDILDDPSKLALASTAIGGYGDNSNARALANIAENVNGPTNAYKGIVSTLGTESQRATRNQEIQTQVTKGANEARESVSGVNLDEEMTNLIQYQHSYAAAAKYLSSLNEVMDSLLSIIR